MRRVLSVFGCCALMVLAAGCADPAADKPAAEVAEATAPTEAPSDSGMILTLGEGSTVGFIGSKITGSHEGGFEALEGEINLVDNDPAASSVHVVIDTTSLWADDPKLTDHLKSEDFFDVATHSTATFTSTGIAAGADGYEVTGNLDLHGVTKSITFPAQIGVEDGRVQVDAEFSIKRFDFDIVYKGRADDLIRDDVVIKLHVVGVAAAAAGGEPAS